MKPIEVIEQFDLYLNQKGIFFEAIAIGGGALSIMGIISRETQDIDILDPKIPDNVYQASVEFAKLQCISTTNLKENWLNNGPDSLKGFLREGWYLRLETLYSGKAIKLNTLGRIDLIGTKLLAYCDRGTDLKDCLDLNPSIVEINELLPWLKNYDLNPDWPLYVQRQIKILKGKLGHDI
jgi:hypothetical protein